MKSFKTFLSENVNHLDLYRRYSSGINKDLIKNGPEKGGKYSFLRNYDTSGKGNHDYEHHDKHEVLKALDSHTHHPSNKLEKPVTSYSGVSAELGKHLHTMSSEKPGFKFKTPAYLSSSHDYSVAHQFAEKNNQGQRHVMVFHLPAGYSKSKSIPNAREGGKSRTDERLFARNQNFKHIKTEKQGSVFHHHFEPE